MGNDGHRGADRDRPIRPSSRVGAAVGVPRVPTGPTRTLPDAVATPVTLRGEIVDSKCYLGVMNPGESKTHRDCAVRCISGGAPPLFVARDRDGRSIQMLLVGDDGRSIHRDVLPWVAEPIEVSGRLASTGDLFVLHANPTAFRRLS